MTRTTARLATLLLAAALGATACGGRGSSAQLPPIPALAARDGAAAGMSLAYPAYPEPGLVEYRVEGTLPGLAAQAAAYRLSATTTDARVARLAAALGLTGTVSSDASGWTVTGSGSALHVQRTAGLPWSLAPTSGSGISSSGCAVAVPVAPPGAKPPAALTPPPACPSPTPVPGLPTRDQAERLARAALSGAGLDLGGALVDTSGGVTAWFVSVIPAVGGVPVTAVPWSVTVGPQGALQSASGWLAIPRSAGDYPLVGVPAGLERLRQGGTWVLRGGPGPLPMMGAGGGGNPVSEVAPALPVAPVQAPPPPVVVTVTGVRLGLAWGTPAGTGGAEAWLVPVYLFELKSGGTVPVLAVSDRFVTPPSTLPGVRTLPAPAPLPGRPVPLPAQSSGPNGSP